MNASPIRCVASLLLLLTACGPAPGPESPAPLSVMTFNILCSICSDPAYDPWDARIDPLLDVMQRHDPDLIGAQEFFLGDEVELFLEELPEYEALYYIDDGHPDATFDNYPDATILYKPARFEVVEWGTFWLSSTPDEPWSADFADTQLWRLVVFADLRDRATGQDVLVMNTHVDNNYPSQEKSAPLLLERLAPWAEKMPVLLMGDFNSKPDSTAYGLLASGTPVLENAFDLVDDFRVDTNQTPAPDYDSTGRIDHFWLGGGDWFVTDWAVDLHVYGGNDRYPSDHRALFTELVWPVEGE